MRALRLLVAALAASIFLPAPSLAAAPAELTARASDPPVLTRYVGTFKADLRWDRFVDYDGDNNYAEGQARVKVSGKLPAVRFAAGKLLGSFGGVPPKSSGTSTSTTSTDDGGTVKTCASKPLTPTRVPPILQPVRGRTIFYAFNSLVAVTYCESTEDLLTFSEEVALPAVPVPVRIRARNVGDKVIKVSFAREVPQADCPDYNSANPGYCTYELKGTLTLRLVPDIDVFHRPPVGALQSGDREWRE